MHLQRNDMLSTEGRAPRARRSCYVNEPAYGFFITGSTIKPMNGVYIRRNPPRRTEEEEERQILLYYEHMDSSWTLVLAETPESADASPYFHRSQGERSEWAFVDERSNDRFTHKGDTIVPGAGIAWKHVHRTSTGARQRSTSSSSGGGGYGSSLRSLVTGGYGGGGNTDDRLASAAQEDDEDELPWQVIAVLDHEILRQLIGGSQYHKEKCSEAKAGRGVVEPPAITTLEGCASLPRGGVMWVYRVVAERGVAVFNGPSREHDTCGHHAEGHHVRGIELRENGKWLRLEPVARRARYSSQYHTREEWVELTSTTEGEGGPQTTVNLVRVLLADTSSATLEGEQVGDVATEAAEAPVMNRGGGGSKARSLAAELLDQPFVPRLDDAGAAEGEAVIVPPPPVVPGTDEEAEAAVAAAVAAAAAAAEMDEDGDVFVDAVEDPKEIEKAAAAAKKKAEEEEDKDKDKGEAEPAAIEAAASSAAALSLAFPVGSAVAVEGLAGADSQKYNGVAGVVISPMEGGRQGVRLEEAPYVGKKLHLKLANLSGLVQDEEEEEEEEGAEEEVEGGGAMARHCRTLGVSLRDVGLLSAESGSGSGGKMATHTGYALACEAPADRIAAALRCTLRDADGEESVSDAAERAYAALKAALEKKEKEKPAEKEEGGDEASSMDVSDADGDKAAAKKEEEDGAEGKEAADKAADKAAAASMMMAPDARVRHGALGSRAALAAKMALSAPTVSDAQDGVAEVKEVLLDELDRSAREHFSLGSSLQQESSDCLRLRVVLTLSYLENNHINMALDQAGEMINAFPTAPAAALVHAKCLLRVGRREEAIKALERAAAAPASSSSSSSSPTASAAIAETDGPWARSVASPMVRAIKAAERRQVLAMDHYERGRFDEAVSAYKQALECVEAGAADDTHCRAALHANVAACLRRDKKQDEAIRQCDKSLLLLPRFTRALFRKAACLLEAGKPKEAVEAFEQLYRVDRDWPKLSDWLLRAHAAMRRSGDKKRDDDDDDDSPSRSSRHGRPHYPNQRKSWYSSNQDGGGGGASEEGGSPGGSGSPAAGKEGADAAAEKLSKESDHYIVLGVTCDATEKQIQQAYRMRSLRYHPDRKGGSTAAFQRIAQAFQTLSDPVKRDAYDQGVDIQSKRGRGSGSDSDSDVDEEHKQSLREEIERKYFPERYDFWPFGDPFINKRKREEKKRRQAGQRSWYDDD